MSQHVTLVNQNEIDGDHAFVVAGKLLVSTTPSFPAGANQVDGSATADAATIITVPAGRSWYGSVTLSASASGTAAVTATPTVTVQGSGTPLPAAGTVVAGLDIRIPAVTNGFAVGQSVTMPNVILTTDGANAVTLRLNTGSATGARAVAVGQLY